MPDSGKPEGLAPGLISLANVQALWEGASLRIGDKVRALALGIIAFTWAVLSADKAPVADLHHRHPAWLLATAALAVVSLLFDLLQSLANYIEFDRLRHWMEDNRSQTGAFHKKSFLHRFADAAFWAKTASCIVACVSVLVLVALSL